MKHLTGEELVDLADGARAESSAPHLQACDACRAQLADLRAIISRLNAVEVPEPSPFFWDRFSSRVRESVAADGGVSRRLSGRAIRPALVISAIAAAAAVIVMVVVMNTSRSSLSVPVPTIAETTAPAEAADGAAMLPPDDPALDIVADLGTELDWDEVHDAGIVAHAGLVDRAVNGLSAGERAELGKLLKQELTGGGN